MRKLLSLFAFLFVIGFCAGQNLPTEATSFVSTYYPNNHITSVAQYPAPSEFAYRVELDMNVVIFFDANGRWIIIESFEQGIPSTLLTQKQKAYIESLGYNLRAVGKLNRKAGDSILLIMEDGAGYRFDAAGNFMRTEMEE